MPTQNYLISCINTQNGRRFPHGVFKLIFFNENCCIVSKIAQKYGFKGPIDNISALDQIMACRRTDENLNQWWLVYWRIYASLGFNESSYIKMNYRCPCKCMGALNKRRSEISFHQRWPVLYFPLWLLFSQNQTFFYTDSMYSLTMLSSYIYDLEDISGEGGWHNCHNWFFLFLAQNIFWIRVYNIRHRISRSIFDCFLLTTITF